MLRIVEQDRVEIQGGTQPEVGAQVARLVIQRLVMVGDIQMYVGAEADDFPIVSRVTVVDEEQIDVRRPA